MSKAPLKEPELKKLNQKTNVQTKTDPRTRIKTNTTSSKKLPPDSIKNATHHTTPFKPIQDVAKKPSTTNKIKTTTQRTSNLVPPKSFKLLKPNTKVPPETIRRMPLRPVVETKIRAPVIALSQHNVMNTIHNVTVISPPSVRKDYAVVPDVLEVPVAQNNRSTTIRTLDNPVVLAIPKAPLITPTPGPVKEAVSFEIQFEPPASSSSKPIINETIVSTLAPIPMDTSAEHQSSADEDEPDYEDDFDSYESDFESYSKSSSSSLRSHSSVSQEKILDNKQQQFDSGLYDLKTDPAMLAPPLGHVFITEDAEAQKDSGFGYPTISPTPTKRAPKAVNQMSKRSVELMSKIQLDTMSYTLFELKPMPYEHYMKLFGHVNATQMSTQTANRAADQDCQTDTKARSTMWTQCPPELTAVRKNRLGCGSAEDDDDGNSVVGSMVLNDTLGIEQSLSLIRKLGVRSNNVSAGTSCWNSQNPSINVERMNGFLHRAATTVLSVMSRQFYNKPSVDSVHLDWQNNSRLRGTKVVNVYGDFGDANSVYTVHSSEQNTQESSLVAVWNTLSPKTPLHVLSSWSGVCCLEVSGRIVYAGLEDGSIALWNLIESREWRQLLTTDDQVCVASHVVSPQSAQICSFGSVVALKHFHQELAQICSLHEHGLLTIWSPLHSDSHQSANTTPSSKNIDHSSPWSTVRLVQSHLIDLRHQYIQHSAPAAKRPESAFDRTRTYFESNIFSDSALQELHAIDSTQSRRPTTVNRQMVTTPDTLQCFDLSILDHSSYCVAINQGVLLTGPLTPHNGSTRFRTIRVSDAACVHATRLQRASSSDRQSALFVGLSDGSVKLVWCSRDDPNSDGMCSEPTATCDGSSAIDPGNELYLSAKSCAIQNIIRDERRDSKAEIFGDTGEQFKIDDDTHGEDNFDSLRYWNQSTVLPALAAREQHVGWMGLCAARNRLFVRCGASLRQFDLDTKVELAAVSSSGIEDAALIGSTGDRKKYLALIENNEVRIHFKKIC